MKVLFAIGSDQGTKNIVDRYYEKFGEVLEYKNVFYFKALVDEVRQNKTYDIIIIHEDLEQYKTKDIEQLDRKLFSYVDSITDEAQDADIIYICSDRRTKEDQFIVRLYSIGIYNLLLGDDRSISNLCETIRKPKTKREAKEYLNIDSGAINETGIMRDDEVDEAQMMNILNYYDRIKNEPENYVSTFDRIAGQYSRAQLKVIASWLPNNVKDVIYAEPKYKFLLLSNGEQQITKADEKTVENPINKIERKHSPNFLEALKKLKYNNNNRQNLTAKGAATLSEIEARRQAERTKKEIDSNRQEELAEQARMEVEARKQRESAEKAKREAEARKLAEEKRQAELAERSKREAEYRKEAELRHQKDLDDRAMREAKGIAEDKGQVELAERAKKESEARGQAELAERAKKEAEDRRQAELAEKAKKESEARGQAELAERAKKEAEDRRQAELAERAKKEAEDRRQAELAERAKKEAEDRRQAELAERAKKEAEDRRQAELAERAKKEAEARKQVELVEKTPKEIEVKVLKKDVSQMEKPVVTVETMREDTNGDQTEQARREEIIRQQENLKKAEETKKLTGLDGNGSKISEEQKRIIEEQKRLAVEQEKIRKAQEEIEAERLKLKQEQARIASEKEQIGIGQTIQTVEQVQPRSTYESVPVVNYNTKKMVVFVGANKAGTTFVVNAVANQLADKKIMTSIVDMTRDKSMYYIYNQNDKTLRRIASECMQKLSDGEDSYMPVSKYLKVYTTIPGSISDTRRSYKHKMIVETVKRNSNVLMIDADFTTPIDYFEQANEIFIVQDMDILKIQETTLFLREMKGRNIDMSKIRVIINKYVKSVLTPKKIVEGLSYYKDPEMTFVDALLNDKIVYSMVPYNLNNYVKYTESLYRGVMDFKGYTAEFLEAINEIAGQVYPINGVIKKSRGLFG